MKTSIACNCLAVLLTSLLWTTFAGADTLYLQQKTMYDPASGNRPSHQMLVPHGWELQGSAFWPQSSCFNNPPSQQFLLTSPDGFGIKMGPHLRLMEFRPNAAGQGRGLRKSELQIDQGLLVLYRPESLDQWKQFYQDKIIDADSGPLTNVRLKSAFHIPELKAITEKLLGPARREIAQRNANWGPIGVHQWLECEALGFNVTCQIDDSPLEIFHILVVSSVITQGPYGHNVTWNIAADIQFFGPAGKLASQMPMLTALANNFHEVPSWAQFKADHMARIDGIQRQGFMERSRLLWQTTREIMDMRQQSFLRNSEINHRMHQRYIDSIHDVQLYQQGGYAYQLPAGYRYVYGDNQGNFILTDDALFQPNVDLQTNQYWERVNPQR